jgi:hypothetical protein
VRLQLEYDDMSVRAIPSLDAPHAWSSAASSAFQSMWRVLSSADDSRLALDRSHLSLSGQLAQHVFQDYSAAFSPPADVDAAMAAASHALPAALHCLMTAVNADPNIATDVSADLLQQVQRLLQNILRVSDVKVRGRCCVLAEVLCRSMRAMVDDKDKLIKAPAVMRHWAEASQHCISRWEGEIFTMHDWILGHQMCLQSRLAEDIVLRILHDLRAQLAEAMLHSLKATLPVADEIHFENYFYSALRLGVQTQARSEIDPSRLNYMQLQTFNVASSIDSFFQSYSPSRIRAELRAKIFEAPDGAEIREKMYDWMRANIPIGFCDDLATDERQSKWMHELCHDADYRITDAALSYLLCRMHVFVFDAAVLCPSASRALDCGADLLERGAGYEAPQGGAVAAENGTIAAAAHFLPPRFLLFVAMIFISMIIFDCVHGECFARMPHV